ncbi:MAG: hypothetical protein SFW67_18485 [Myxococcaceae bacterium]|nr:hypothetical protein [Myxococcaceae bacterium]
MDLLLLALLLALAVWTARKVRAAWVERRALAARAATPGYSPDNPIVLKAGLRVEDFVERARCVCGGKVQFLGETSRLGLRVARGRCVECERDVDLSFVLPQLLN